MTVFLKKIPAGALQYTILISVIVLILLTSLITVFYLNFKLNAKSTNFRSAVQKVNDVFLTLSDYEVSYDDKKSWEENDQKIHIEKKHWGIFDLTKVTVENRKENYEKIALTGFKLDTVSALYLSDNQRPLALVGNTTIKGNVWLSETGFRRGNIGGVSYYNEHFIYGNIKKSENNLPRLQNEVYYKNIIDISRNLPKNYFLLSEHDRLISSFNDTTRYYYSKSDIVLQNKILYGNIIIESGSSVTIDKTAELHDIIIIAPKIIVKTGVRGNFQAIASESIVTEEKVQLDYPSALVLVNNTIKTNEDFQEKSPMFIEENVIIKGVVLYLSHQISENNYKSHLYLSKNSTVEGFVYCEQNMELRGNVYGFVITNTFLTKEKGSIYFNHLLDVTLDRSKLSNHFVGDSQENLKKTGVAKWLY